jgi:hypothetical protein
MAEVSPRCSVRERCCGPSADVVKPVLRSKSCVCQSPENGNRRNPKAPAVSRANVQGLRSRRQDRCPSAQDSVGQDETIGLASRPAFVPRAIRRRQEMAGWAGAPNSQVSVKIRLSAQVAESAPRTLSRWRHGFKSRWDYERRTPGQGMGPESVRPLNSDSNAGYPANIPHGIECSEWQRGTRVEGGCTRPGERDLPRLEGRTLDEDGRDLGWTVRSSFASHRCSSVSRRS